MIKFVTWNVNSIRIRTAQVVEFCAREHPDLVLLQEIKCEESQFPKLFFSEIGYRVEVVGQKSYNGVAVLSRDPITVLRRSLPGWEEDKEARYMEVTFGGITIANLYLPNGNSGGDTGYQRKLAWMESLRRHARTLLDDDRDVMLAGDFNVCPTDLDLAEGVLSPNDALVRNESRAGFRALIWLGLTDAARALHPTETLYTFWDYQGAAWQRDRGLRIDHALLSPRVAEHLQSVTIARSERDKPQPSDHAPVIVTVSS